MRELVTPLYRDKETDPESSSNLVKSTQVLTVVDVREGLQSSMRLGPACTLEARRKLFTPKSQFKNILVALSVGLRGRERWGSKETCSSSWVGFLALPLTRGKLLHSLWPQFANL